jgi:hypothetical protein
MALTAISSQAPFRPLKVNTWSLLKLPSTTVSPLGLKLADVNSRTDCQGRRIRFMAFSNAQPLLLRVFLRLASSQELIGVLKVDTWSLLTQYDYDGATGTHGQKRSDASDFWTLVLFRVWRSNV